MNSWYTVKNFNFIRNYFKIFLSAYIIIIFTKFMFVLYLKESFNEFEIYTLIYAIFWGYKFDFATSSIIALLITLFDFNKKIYTSLGAFLFMSLFLMQISDILYFNESSRHIGYEITDTLTDASSLFMTAYSQHTFITVTSMVFAIILFFATQILLKGDTNSSYDKTLIVKKLLLIIISLFFIRGMFQSIPLNPWQSNQIGDSKLAVVSLNSTYNVLYSLANKRKKLQQIDMPIVADNTIKESFKFLYSYQEDLRKFPLIDTKPNIVFFFLESWSAKILKPYGFEHDTTPYFNDILQKSIRPKVMIAGGHRTTEGMFCALSSYQNPLGKSVAKTQLQNFKYTTIVDMLKKDGYSSAFFQGSSKETSGTGSFAQSLGFSKSYGKKDVKKRLYEENYWGVHDSDLYNFVNTKITDKILKEPFVIGINGATTHDDKIPKGIKKINFVDEQQLNNQLNALHFSDFALKNFMQNIETKYPNTIFVLLADHCGGGIVDSMQNYAIPFAIYSQKLIQAKYYDNYISQRDIAPTLYDMLIGDYVNEENLFSGKSLLRDSKKFADYYHNGTLGWIEGNRSIEVGILTDKMQCFNLKLLEKTKRNCTQADTISKQRALSFTNISQKLLFSNELNTFNIYKQFSKSKIDEK